ncbi:MAG TPA: zinc ribbon domain-containing protein [Terracidiphilus sp.]|nr:zinc ribbon domain-containing protein [Terracidiphilus sp.]
MFCIHCGAPNPENASFCSACGKAIGASANQATAAVAALPILSSAEKSYGNAAGQFATGQGATGQVATGQGATGQGAPQISLPALPAQPAQTAQPAQPAQPPQLQPSPQAQYPPAIAGKGKPVLWVLGGFGACLLIVIAVAMGSRLNQNSSGSEAARENVAPDAAPAAAPAAYTAPAPAPAADTATAPSADTTPAPAADTPVSTPVQPAPQPAPAAPQNPIVGDWKATTFIGSTIGLHLGADGRYVLNPGSDEGVYSYSSGDGTLRLQSNSFFSEGIMVWSCQVSGDSLSCIDPKGGGHVYNRVR